MIKGYGNRIAYIDLTRRKIIAKETPEDLAKRFIGGKGLAAKLLYDLSYPHMDPLSPVNPLIFTVSPLTATGAPGTARGVVATKSPKTHTYTDGYAGGYWSAWLKLAGYDALVITGKADKLTYIYIHDDQIELRSAEHVRDYGIYATTDTLIKDVGDKDAKVACIGPAGENLVKYANITTDYSHKFGRGGVGAVMGSKNLKAIVISADPKNPRFEIAKPDEFEKFNKEFTKKLLADPEVKEFREKGTMMLIDLSDSVGVLPTKNFQKGTFEYAKSINFDSFLKFRISKATCFKCPMACKHVIKIENKKWGSFKLEGPEYECTAMGGSNTGLSDPKAIAAWIRLVDDLGLDGISTGNIIGLAMEAYEKGYITKEDIGFELKFGDADAQMELTKMICERRGIGNILAEGAREFAKWLGGDAYKLIMECKGLEYPAYDPRGSISMALAYATADRGGCHQRAWSIAYEAFGDMDPYTTEGKAELVKRLQDLNAVKWSIGICDMISIEYDDMATYLNLVTGWNLKPDDLKLIGERIYNLTRLFNVREGFTRRDDYIPHRIAYEPMPEGKAKGRKVTPEDFNKMLDEYYELRGWDKNGIPKRETLEKLGLVEEFEKLYKPY